MVNECENVCVNVWTSEVNSGPTVNTKPNEAYAQQIGK